MNNQWNMNKPYWYGNKNIPHFTPNWNSNSWQSHSSNKWPRRKDYNCRPNRDRQNNSNARNQRMGSFSNRWEPIGQNNDFCRRDKMKRNDFNRNPEKDGNNFRKRLDYKHYDRCVDIMLQDPAEKCKDMKNAYWDKVDAKDDLRILASEKNSLPVHDGITPVGKEGISKAWHCNFCNVVFLELEERNLHLMQKNHYLRYASFCKKYAEEKLIKLELERNAKKEKMQRKSQKRKLMNCSSSKSSAVQIEERKKSKVSLKGGDVLCAETLSLEEEDLNYDY